MAPELSGMGLCIIRKDRTNENMTEIHLFVEFIDYIYTFYDAVVNRGFNRKLKQCYRKLSVPKELLMRYSLWKYPCNSKLNQKNGIQSVP